LGVILIVLCLIVRVVNLSRRSRQLHDEVRRLEGVCNGEKQEKFKDTDMGGFEGGS